MPYAGIDLSIEWLAKQQRLHLNCINKTGSPKTARPCQKRRCLLVVRRFQDEERPVAAPKDLWRIEFFGGGRHNAVFTC